MRRAPLVVVALAALLFAPQAAGASESLRLTPVGKPRFPDRAYVMTLPGGTPVDPGQVEVGENGKRVAGLAVSPANRAAAKLPVVLVIDASRSMRGRPIDDAMEAARAFARRRNEAQPLGAVTFNSDTETLLPLTTDAATIEQALDSAPTLRRNTYVYDGVEQAVDLLADADLAGGSVIVLSDGADTGSDAQLSEVAAHARSEGIRVFSVGLESSAFEPDALRELAGSSRGRYSEAGEARDLAPIYDRLGAELGNEYLIQYRSLQGPRSRVTVRASVEGLGSATASYRSPAISLAAAEPYERNDFWRSAFALVLVSLIAGALVGLALFTFFARPGRRRLSERMAMFISPAGSERDGDATSKRPHLAALRVVEERLARLRGWAAFEEELDVANVRIQPPRVVAGTVVATLFVTWLLVASSGVAALGLLGLVGVPAGVHMTVRWLADKQRRLFDEQLADNLQVIASAQRAGHSFLGALTVSVQEAPEPTKREFERALADERLGVPIEDALETVARRMASRDLEQVILVARLQRETGGNTAEVLDRVSDTARERSELRRLVRTLTAQGRMSRWVITALPIGLLVLVSTLNPGYTAPLFESGGGRTALAIGGFLMVMGSLAIKRIVTIKV